MRLVVVEMGAVAVNLLAQAVAGAVQDGRGRTRPIRAPRGRRGRLPSRAPAGRPRPPIRSASTAASRASRAAVKAAVTGAGTAGAGEPHPADVGEDRARRSAACPTGRAAPRCRGVIAREAVGRGLVVRVAGVLLRRDDRRGVGDQPLLVEPLHHQRLDVVLGGRPRRSRIRRGDGVEGAILDPVEALGGLAVRTQAPRRSTPPRTVWIRSAEVTTSTPCAAHQFDGAGVDPRHVRDGAHRRVLHGDPPQARAARSPGRPRARSGPA